jgi:serine/threonine protein kinase
MNVHPPVAGKQLSASPEEDRQENNNSSIPSTPAGHGTPNSNAHRQIIGNYELGRVLATGDFDCRTRLCTHVATGVHYVVRIYDKRVLAEAQWMWDRVAESIHVLRKLPRNKHVLEMVECFETNASVYILMHLFPSMNLTKLFTDAAAQAELLYRLHLLSRASLRASTAAQENHPANVSADADDKGNEEARRGSSNGSHHNSSFTSVTMPERSSFRHLKNGRQRANAHSSNDHYINAHGGTAETSAAGEHNERAAQHADGEGQGEERKEKRGGAFVFPGALSTASVATAAAIHALEGPIPQHTPLALIRVLFEQIVKGVAFLHQNGVAHTGIAPDHLLVSPDGLLRIGNMISACFCAPGERLHELRGTMHTVAPEVLRGEAYDPFKADAWALGVVFYFMLNRGRYPHDGANTLRHILHGHTRPPRPGLPAVALDMLSRLMQAKPEDRLPVDAILAHPFFTATLSTVEEEMMADAAEGQTGNGRRSVYTGGAPASSPKRRENHNYPSMASAQEKPWLSNNSSVSSSFARSATHRRSGRGTGGRNDGDSELLTGSWGTPHQQPRATIFSASSESNSVVVPGAGSTTLEVSEDVTSAMGEGGGTLGACGSGHAGGRSPLDALDAADTFTPQRRTSVADGRNFPRLPAPLRSHAAADSDAVDPCSRVAGFSSRNSSSAQSDTKTKPVWRPERAASIDALEDLAARVIQHHFRTVFHRRQYKAETRALMKQGQSMYLSSPSSSIRDTPSASTTDTPGQRRSVLQNRRSSSLSIQPLLASGTASVPPVKSQHVFHRRVSTSRTLLTNTAPPSTTPSERQRKTSLHNGTDSGGAAAAAAAAASFSALTAARWPSSVWAPNPSRSRFSYSSVTIDTRGGGGSLPVSNDGLDAEAGVGEVVLLPRRTSDDPDAEVEDRDGTKKQPRAGSLTLPSLADTACGADWAGEATPMHFRLPGGGATSSHSRVTNNVSNTANVSLPSQPGRRRSTISTVVSSVATTCGSFERQRGGNSTVPDCEVCPLCHREPYAIRSIAIRPYAATPYQFKDGAFTKLLE